MCKSTKGTQAASSGRLPDIVPNTTTGPGGGGGGGGPATPPANQFGGFQEHVPERVFVSTAGTPAFLLSATRFYTYFGLQPRNINSIEHLLQILGDPGNTTNNHRILLVSHAHPRGMIIPFFTGGVNGTNKEVFREFAKSDLDGLKVISPFNPIIFNWSSVFVPVMTNIRTFIALPANSAYASALTPFGLQASNTPPAGSDLREFFELCFDYVFIKTAGKIKNSTNGNITGPQRTILNRFVGEIITQVGNNIINTTINGNVITATQIETLRGALTHLHIDDLNTGGFEYQLSDYGPTNMNYYPTLDNAVRAVRGDFRANLNRARLRFLPNTAIDIRGCRAGEVPDYITSIREFFSRPVSPQLTASAPKWFQSYPPLAWDRPRNRADITTYLSGRIFSNTVARDEQRAAVRAWAQLIKADPLHTNFWTVLLNGTAVNFCGLAWRNAIPPLFIPAPGLSELIPMDFTTLITRLRDFFNVPAASVPAAGALNTIQTLINALPGYQSLLATVPDSTSLPQHYDRLKQINTHLGQGFVPATAPTPLTVTEIRQYQTALSGFLETNNLTLIKNFMTAARESLETGDGIYYYLLFAGLPIFFFNNTTFVNHNGLMVLQNHENVAMQSWYKCIWAEPLPATAENASTGARINQENARRAPMLQDDHDLTQLAICPVTQYGQQIQFNP